MKGKVLKLRGPDKVEWSLLKKFYPTFEEHCGVSEHDFDFLTFGSVSSAFTDATELFGFGDGSLYFEIVQLSDRVQLEVKQIPGGGDLWRLTLFQVVQDIFITFITAQHE